MSDTAAASCNVTNLHDDSSFAFEHFSEGTTENLIWLLDKAIHEYTKAQEILTDHGSKFYSVRRRESSFDAFCRQQGIKHTLQASLQRPERFDDDLEPTTLSVKGFPSIENSSNTTTSSDRA